MSVRRALVDCVVLSLQDDCLFYPSCKNCFSKINEDQRDATSLRCCKCGSRCLRDQVEFRYRLSVKVNRDSLIFGVTVFGSSLNQFFGVSATGLKRLVENSDGPVEASTRSTLLIKSVKDCFIGRHFIFGIKVPGTDAGSLFGSNSKETVHYVASQMILPSASAPRGCTVVSYYRELLQKTLDYKVRSNDPDDTRNRRAETTLRLIPPRSPTGSFNASVFNTSFLSQSLQRSQDCSLSPTPPWEQSLGLVTSSAEQEEGWCTQDEDERSRRTNNVKTPQQLQRGSVEERDLPPRLSSNSPAGNLDTWFSPSQSGNKPEVPLHYETEEFSTRELTKTSLVWEDLPFSESLSEFLCKENKDEDVVSKTTKDQEETIRNNQEIKSPDESLLNESTQVTESQSPVLLDVTPATDNRRSDGQDLSDPVNKSRSRSVCFQQEETSLSPETEEEEEETYDCSVDLFSSSPVIDTDTNTLNTETQTVRITNSLKRRLKREKADVSYSTPDKHKLKSNKRLNRDGLVTLGLQDLDFIPPSQSTPLVNVQHTSWTVNEFSSSSVRSRTSSRHDHRFTPRRRFLEPVQQRNDRQRLKVQRAALNLDDSKCDSSVQDVTVSDVSDVVVPPTPGGEKLRRRVQTTTRSLDLTWNLLQTEGVNCKRNLLHHHHHHHHPSALPPSTRGHSQIEKCDGETADLDSSQDDEKLDCDWSRDLFSDST